MEPSTLLPGLLLPQAFASLSPTPQSTTPRTSDGSAALLRGMDASLVASAANETLAAESRGLLAQLRDAMLSLERARAMAAAVATVEKLRGESLRVEQDGADGALESVETTAVALDALVAVLVAARGGLDEADGVVAVPAAEEEVAVVENAVSAGEESSIDETCEPVEGLLVLAGGAEETQDDAGALVAASRETASEPEGRLREEPASLRGSGDAGVTEIRSAETDRVVSITPHDDTIRLESKDLNEKEAMKSQHQPHAVVAQTKDLNEKEALKSQHQPHAVVAQTKDLNDMEAMKSQHQPHAVVAQTKDLNDMEAMKSQHQPRAVVAQSVESIGTPTGNTEQSNGRDLPCITSTAEQSSSTAMQRSLTSTESSSRKAKSSGGLSPLTHESETSAFSAEQKALGKHFSPTSTARIRPTASSTPSTASVTKAPTPSSTPTGGGGLPIHKPSARAFAAACLARCRLIFDSETMRSDPHELEKLAIDVSQLVRVVEKTHRARIAQGRSLLNGSLISSVVEATTRMGGMAMLCKPCSIAVVRAVIRIREPLRTATHPALQDIFKNPYNQSLPYFLISSLFPSSTSVYPLPLDRARELLTLLAFGHQQQYLASAISGFSAVFKHELSPDAIQSDLNAPGASRLPLMYLAVDIVVHVTVEFARPTLVVQLFNALAELNAQYVGSSAFLTSHTKTLVEAMGNSTKRTEPLETFDFEGRLEAIQRGLGWFHHKRRLNHVFEERRQSKKRARVEILVGSSSAMAFSDSE